MMTPEELTARLDEMIAEAERNRDTMTEIKEDRIAMWWAGRLAGLRAFLQAYKNNPEVAFGKAGTASAKADIRRMLRRDVDLIGEARRG